MTWRDTTAALLLAAAGIAWAWFGRVPLAMAPFAAAVAAAGSWSLVCFVWTLCAGREQPDGEVPTKPARWFPGLHRMRRSLSLAEWATLAATGFVLAALSLPPIQTNCVGRGRAARTMESRAIPPTAANKPDDPRGAGQP